MTDSAARTGVLELRVILDQHHASEHTENDVIVTIAYWSSRLGGEEEIPSP